MNQNQNLDNSMDAITPCDAIMKKQIIDVDRYNKLCKCKELSQNAMYQLKKMKPHINGTTKTCEIEAEFKLSKPVAELHLGRLYEKTGGLQSINADVRAYLARGYYFDIDMVNAHYAMILNLCKLWKLPVDVCEPIEFYVQNRDACLRAVSSNRKYAKTEFTKILYGGIPHEFDVEFEDFDEQANDTTFLQKLKDSVDVVIAHTCVKYAHLSKNTKIKQSKNKHVSLFCFVIHSLERKILREADAYLTSQGFPMDVYIHDGGLVRNLKKLDKFPESVLRGLEQHIKDSIGFDVQWTEKPLETSLFQDQPDDDDAEIPESKTYDAVKAEFEKHHFMYNGDVYVIGSSEFDTHSQCLIKSSDRILGLTKAKAKFGNIMFLEKVETKNGRKIQSSKFFSRWLEDENRLDYDILEFLPKQRVPRNTYNMFNGLNIENEILSNPEIDKITPPDFEKTYMYRLIYESLCDYDDEKFNYLMKIIYTVFYRPYDKTGVMVVFFSHSRGVGKSLFLEFLNRIIGSEYYISTTRPELFFGKFNSVLSSKLVAVYEEGDINKELTSTMKDVITNPSVNIEKKGIDPVKINNFTQFFQLTNFEKSIIVEPNDRRVVVYKCNETLNDEHFFTQCVSELKSFEHRMAFYEYVEARYQHEHNMKWFQNNRPAIRDTKAMQLSRETLIVRFFYYLAEHAQAGEEFFFKEYARATEIHDVFTQYMRRDAREYHINTFAKNLSLKQYESFITKKLDHTKTSIYKIDYQKMRDYLYERAFIEQA